MLRLAAILTALSVSQAAYAQITGAGATFPAPVYTSWAAAYSKQAQVPVTYAGVGSGEGLKQIISGAVDFGASDAPLSAEDVAKHGLVQFPTLVGGIVPVVNLPGVKAGALRLDGEVLAQIFLGRITAWNAPQIQALNPNVKLPRLPIKRVVREESSGTTAGFTKYLAAASPEWAKELGSGLQVRWPGTVITGRGNDGVSAKVKENEGSVGYVGYNIAVKQELAYTQLRNRDARFVAPSEDAFAAAVRASGLSKNPQQIPSLIDQTGAATWPIAETTYILVPRNAKDAQRAKATMKFLYWVFLQGDDMANGTGFAPLPSQVQAKVVSLFREIRDADGKPIDYMTGGEPLRFAASDAGLAAAQ